MVIFLYGEDSYRRLRKLNSIISKYKEKHGNLSLDNFDFTIPNKAIELLEVFLSNHSMFEPQKTAILSNLSFKEIKEEKESQKTLKKILKNNLENKDNIILISTNERPGSVFDFLLEKPVESQVFEELSFEKLISFIASEAKDLGLSLTKSEVASIADNFKNDTWGIITEIEKMSLVNRFLPSTSTAKKNYFELANAFKFGRDARQRLLALELLLSDLKEDPARIFNGLSYGNPATTGGTWYDTLANYDVDVKSGKLDYAEVLVDLAIM